MSFFDEVETTVANTRFLQAVEDTGPPQFELTDYKLIVESGFEARLRETLTLRGLVSKPVGAYLFRCFLIKRGAATAAAAAAAAGAVPPTAAGAPAAGTPNGSPTAAAPNGSAAGGGKPEAAGAAGSATAIVSVPAPGAPDSLRAVCIAIDEYEKSTDPADRRKKGLRVFTDFLDPARRATAHTRATAPLASSAELKAATSPHQASSHIAPHSVSSGSRALIAAAGAPPNNYSSTGTSVPLAGSAGDAKDRKSVASATDRNAAAPAASNAYLVKPATSSTVADASPQSGVSASPKPGGGRAKEKAAGGGAGAGGDDGAGGDSDDSKDDRRNERRGDPINAEHLDDDDESDNDENKAGASPVGGPHTGIAVPTAAGAAKTKPLLVSTVSATAMNSTMSSLALGFDTKRGETQRVGTNIKTAPTLIPPTPTTAAGSMTDRAATAATNAAAAASDNQRTSSAGDAPPPSPPATVTISGFASGTGVGAAASVPPLVAASAPAGSDTIQPVVASADPAAAGAANSGVPTTGSLSPTAIGATRNTGQSITSPAAIANHNKALIRLMALDEVSVLCERIRRQLVEVDPTQRAANVRLFEPIATGLFLFLDDLFGAFVSHNNDTYRRFVQLSHYTSQPVSIKQFRIFRVIGRGAFGAVSAVQKIDTHAIFAMKEMNKKQVKNNKSEWMCVNEKKVLSRMRSPFVLGLKYSFHNEKNLYLIFDMCSGGDLKFHLRSGLGSGKDKYFGFDRAQFYAAEVLLGLEHIHAQNIVYRDLKPNNILLDDQGHVKISDLGLTIKLRKNKILKHLAGTAGYWAPEIVTKTGTYKQSDYWSFATFLYEMLCGRRPRCSCAKHTREWCPFGQRRAMEENAQIGGGAGTGTESGTGAVGILKLDIDYPADRFPPAAVDLLQRLFVVDPFKRLGANGADEIKSHPFFSGIDWVKLANMEITPPFKPDTRVVNAQSIGEVGEFNRGKFKKIKLTDEDEKYYENFSFVSDDHLQQELVTALRKQDSAPEPTPAQLAAQQAANGQNAGAGGSFDCCTIL